MSSNGSNGVSSTGITSTKLGLDRQDSCHSGSASRQSVGRMRVKVRKANNHFGGGGGRLGNGDKEASSGGSPKIKSYRMSSLPRGLALIVEIQEYDNNVMDTRHGSQYDVENLTQLLEQLHFEVRHKKNLDRRSFNNTLLEFAKDKVHASADMAVVAVLSHGREGGIYTSDGVHVDTESIYEKFNNENCPALRGKPKFFIVQACRGDLRDKTYYSTDDPNRLPVRGVLNIGRKRKRRSRRDSAGQAAAANANLEKQDEDKTDGSSPSSQELNRAGPTWEDMIIAYSTIPRYQSLRDHDTGSWFVQSLVEVFMNHAYDLDLIDLLLITSEVLSRFGNEESDAQTCNIELRHIYKRIFFNPGLSGPSAAIQQEENGGDSRGSSEASSPPSLLAPSP